MRRSANPTRFSERNSPKTVFEGKVWQYFTVVPDFCSVGVKDGKRTFAYPVIIRAVNTVDAMTATVENVPFALLSHITDQDNLRG